MCLILIAWQAHADFPLVVAANRDEYHTRPAEAAAFWKDQPDLLAGRDLEAGGTWLGASRSGKFAAVTNYRGGRDANAVESRGALVTRFIADRGSVGDFAQAMARKKSSYSGFNLLLADQRELWWLSNRNGGPRRLDPGLYALGNLLLDTPEVAEPKIGFAQALEHALAFEPLFSVLAAARIVAPDYGTRCATVLLRARAGGVQFAERGFDATGEAGETTRFQFRLAS